ncbi:MAG: hypothetical protein FWD45_03235, partial [Coriobacteriia bacterium]|nr:hypothetical protein [Coriobacteriia bacterium]
LEYAFVVGDGTLASAFSLKKIIAATLSVSTAITTIAVAVIMLSPPAVDNKDAAAIGTVVFDGGEAGYDYLNPKHASPLTDSIYGELTVLDWRITSLDGAVTYYSGQGNDADDALRQLLVDGSDGEYLLVYTLEDETGSTYSLSHSFSIRREH